MGRLVRLVASVAIALAAIARAACAELMPERRKEAEALIAQFTDRRFEARQEAVAKLVAMGPDVLSLLKRTIAETKDAEVRLRCEMAMKGIAEAFGTDAGGRSLAEMNLDVSKITLDVKGRPLWEVLEAFAEQSGNRVLIVDETHRENRVTLSLKESPYWQAVNVLCGETGLILKRVNRPADGLGLVPSESRDLGADAGPVVFKFYQVRAAQVFRPRRATTSLDYGCNTFWEDRLPVIAGWISIDGAETDDGAKLGTGTSVLGVVAFHRTTVPVGQFAVFIRLPPADLRKVKRVTGTVTMVFASGKRTLRIDDALGTPGKSTMVDDASLEVLGTKRTGQTVHVSCRLKRDGKPAIPFADTVNTSYGFFLSTGGETRLSGHLVDGDPRYRLVQESGFKMDGPDDATFSVAFKDPAGAGPRTLLFVFPAETLTRKYPLRLENLPQP